MSLEAITRVLDLPADAFRSTGQRFVLMVLANYANEDGECWPRVATIARQTSQSERMVRRHLTDLETAGLVAKVERLHHHDGSFAQWVLRLTLSDETQRPPAATGARPAATGDHAYRPPVTTPAATGDHPSGHRWPDKNPQENLQQQPSDEPPSPTADDDASLSDARALAEHLADRLAARGAKQPTVTATWVRDMDRLLRLDGRSPDEVRRVIDWLDAARDPVASFWQPNVRSPATLRSRWDQMAEQYRARRASPTSASGASTVDAVAQYLEQGPDR